MNTMVEEVKTKSDKGKDLVVRISNDSVRAYDEPELRVFGKEKGKAEKKLEEKMASRPVMKIDKLGENDFHVDFRAGLQRARASDQTKEDLTESVDLPMYGGPDIHSDKGWLEWIGLDPDSEVLDEFLGRKKKKELNDEVL